jgi:hypothetical protein
MKIHWRPVTKILLVTTALVWAVYDVFPFLNPERGDTISEVILYYALRSLFIPYAFGVLCGHFFFPRDGAKQKPKILIPLSLFVLMYDVIAHVFDVSFMIGSQSYPYVPFLVGIPLGTLLWPQSRSDKIPDVNSEENSDADSGNQGIVRK